MKTPEEIKNIVRNHSEKLRQQYGLKGFALFGSAARGDMNEKSDIDILAETERPIGLITLCGAENYLSEILGVKVDLVLRRSVRKELRDSILKEAVPV